MKKLGAVASETQKKGLTDDISIINVIQKRLATVPLDKPEAMYAAASVINYASFVREKSGLFPNAERVRSEVCKFVQIDGDKSVIRLTMDNPHMSGCRMELDGLSITGGIIQDALVTYKGGAVKLNNVRFVNCIFEISVPASAPSEPAMHFANEILEKNIGPKPSFTATLG